jgi:hypothetical protein
MRRSSIFRSVTSRAVMTTRSTNPPADTTGTPTVSMSTIDPSTRSRRSSIDFVCRSAMRRRCASRCLSRSSGWTKSSALRPIIASGS